MLEAKNRHLKRQNRGEARDGLCRELWLLISWKKWTWNFFQSENEKDFEKLKMLARIDGNFIE